MDNQNNSGLDSNGYKKSEKPWLKIFLVIIAVLIVMNGLKSCAASVKKSISNSKSNTAKDTSATESKAEKEVDLADKEIPVEDKDWVYLYEYDWFNASDNKGGFKIYEDVRDNYGETYTNGIGGRDAYNANWAEYKLNKQYSTFTGTVVMNYDYRGKDSEDSYVKIYGDDVLLYTSPLITRGVEPDTFSVDVSDIDTLKVSIQGQDYIRVVDAILYKEGATPSEDTSLKDKESQRSVNRYLANMDWFSASDNKGGFRVYDMVVDNFGNTYSNGLGGQDAYNENWAEYKLNKQYSTFTGTVVMNSEYKGESSDITYVNIYGDDILLYTSPLIACGVEPNDFQIDVSSVDVLKVTIQGQNQIRIVDAYLSTDGQVQTSKVEYTLPNQVALGDAVWYNSSTKKGFKVYSSAKDAAENNYSNGVGGSDGYSDNWCIYRLDGQANNMVGKVILNYDYANKEPSTPVYVQIFCDDEMRFESSIIGPGYAGEEFDIDLSGVKDLKVLITGQNYARIVDCYINK